MSDFMDEVIAEIQNQIYQREMARIWEFNLMLVGPNAIGKSTLVKSLFRGMITPSQQPRGQPRLNVYTDLLEENGVKLRLRCIETSRFNYIDQELTDDLVQYIKQQYIEYFKSQRRSKPWKAPDTRVHCCLYLISPFGDMHLRQEDIDCMLALHDLVNLVPVIVQADVRDLETMRKIKENVRNELDENGIKYYQFYFPEKEDADRAELVKVYAAKHPFAVIAADEPRVIDKKTIWARECHCQNIIDIDNERTCDFDALQKLLVRHCMLNLMDDTHEKHYIKFRAGILKKALESESDLLDMGLLYHEVKRIQHDLKAIDFNQRCNGDAISTK